MEVKKPACGGQFIVLNQKVEFKTITSKDAILTVLNDCRWKQELSRVQSAIEQLIRVTNKKYANSLK